MVCNKTVRVKSHSTLEIYKSCSLKAFKFPYAWKILLAFKVQLDSTRTVSQAKRNSTSQEGSKQNRFVMQKSPSLYEIGGGGTQHVLYKQRDILHIGICSPISELQIMRSCIQRGVDSLVILPWGGFFVFFKFQDILPQGGLQFMTGLTSNPCKDGGL